MKEKKIEDLIDLLQGDLHIHNKENNGNGEWYSLQATWNVGIVNLAYRMYVTRKVLVGFTCDTLRESIVKMIAWCKKRGYLRKKPYSIK